MKHPIPPSGTRGSSSSVSNIRRTQSAASAVGLAREHLLLHSSLLDVVMDTEVMPGHTRPCGDGWKMSLPCWSHSLPSPCVVAAWSQSRPGNSSRGRVCGGAPAVSRPGAATTAGSSSSAVFTSSHGSSACAPSGTLSCSDSDESASSGSANVAGVGVGTRSSCAGVAAVHMIAWVAGGSS